MTLTNKINNPDESNNNNISAYHENDLPDAGMEGFPRRKLAMTLANKINNPEESNNNNISAYHENDLPNVGMEAYIELNKELDEISNFLDALEQKNDSLHAEITKLLEESKQIRSEIKSEST